MTHGLFSLAEVLRCSVRLLGITALKGSEWLNQSGSLEALPWLALSTGPPLSAHLH